VPAFALRSSASVCKRTASLPSAWQLSQPSSRAAPALCSAATRRSRSSRLLMQQFFRDATARDAHGESPGLRPQPPPVSGAAPAALQQLLRATTTASCPGCSGSHDL
jgi:hypothetical protein